LNLELTLFGAKLGKKQYDELVTQTTAGALQSGTYYVNLTKKEVLGTVLHDRATVLFRQGQVMQAVSDFTKAIDLNARLPEAYNNRGVAQNRLGRYREAIQDYDGALLLDPQQAKAHFNKGLCLFQMSHYDECIKECDAQLVLTPTDGETYYERGLAKDKAGKRAEAEQDIMTARNLGFVPHK
jgi:Flp pilus assembly protein TadD